MNKIIEIMLCGGIVALEIIIIVAIGLTIQFIAYRFLSVNLYKSMIKFSRNLQKYLNNKLYV